MVTPSHLIRVWCSTCLGVCFLLLAQGQLSEANTNWLCCGLWVCFFSFQETVFLEAAQNLCSPITWRMLTPVSASQPTAVPLRPALYLRPFFEDICRDVWPSLRLTGSAHRLYMGRVAEGPPIWCMHPVLVESKRQLPASGSASLCPGWLCWKNNVSGSASCSFLSFSRATGVKTHLGTHHCLCWHTLLPSSHS